MLQTARFDWVGVGVRTAGMVLDPLVQAVFLALQSSDQPSVFYKIAFDTLTPYGEIQLLSRGGVLSLRNRAVPSQRFFCSRP